MTSVMRSGAWQGRGDEEVLANAKDAFAGVLEAYQDLGKELPHNLQTMNQDSPALIETIISAIAFSHLCLAIWLGHRSN